MLKPHITYSGYPLDRRAGLRVKTDDLRMVLSEPTARIVPVWNQKHLFDVSQRAVATSYVELATRVDIEALTFVFLGYGNDGTPWFALGMPESEAPPDLGLSGEFRTLNEMVTLLPPYSA